MRAAEVTARCNDQGDRKAKGQRNAEMAKGIRACGYHRGAGANRHECKRAECFRSRGEEEVS